MLRYSKGVTKVATTITKDQKTNISVMPAKPILRFLAVIPHPRRAVVAGPGRRRLWGRGRVRRGGDAVEMSGDGWGKNFEKELLKDMIPFMDRTIPYMLTASIVL